MKRRTLWILILAGLTLGAAAWLWLRPYQWRPPSDSPVRIESARLRRDHSYYWLDLRLRAVSATTLPEPLLLLDSAHQTIKPAQIDLEGSPAAEPNDSVRLGEIQVISLKFWLEESQLTGPLSLHAGPAQLQVRSRSGTPALENGESESFHTHRW